MDRAIHVAALEEIDKEIAVLKAKLERLQPVRDYHAEHAAVAEARTTSPISPPRPREIADRFSATTQMDAAYEVLKEAAEPLPTAEIARRMMAGGFPGGQNPVAFKRLRKSLFTGMTRNPSRFAKAGEGMWIIVPSSPHPAS